MGSAAQTIERFDAEPAMANRARKVLTFPQEK